MNAAVRFAGRDAFRPYGRGEPVGGFRRVVDPGEIGPAVAIGIRDAAELDARGFAERLTQPDLVALHAFQDTGQSAQLHKAHRAAEFVHADAHAEGLENRMLAGRNAFDIPFESRVVEANRPAVDFVVVRRNHPAFAGGEILVVLKADRARLAHRTHGAPAYARAGGLGAVLEDGDPVSVRHLQDGGHVGDRPGHVHGDDDPGAGGDAPFDVFRVEIEGFIDVGENRHGTQMHDGVDVGNPHEGRQDDFRARTHVQCGEGHGEGRASAVGGEGKAGADVTGISRFEPVHLAQGFDAVVTKGRPGLDDLDGSLLLLFPVSRSTGYQRRPFFSADRFSAVDCQGFRHGRPASGLELKRSNKRFGRYG